MKRLALVLTIAVLLAGCTATGPKERIGGVLGAAGGGLLGAQFGGGTGQLALTALGAVGGFILGSSVGRSLDDVDRLKHQRAVGNALETLPSGSSTTWRNPDSGNSGSVVPNLTYQRTDGAYCRKFTQTISVSGQTERSYGTACRQPNGSWRIMN